MRILYITNGFPYPLTSGYLRHYHLIRGLSARHEITLGSMVGGDFRPEHLDGLRPYTEHVETFRSASRSRSGARRLLGRVQRLALSGGNEAAGRQLAEWAGRALDRRDVDIVVLSGKRTHSVIDRLHGTPLVVDLCDATSARLRGTLPHVGPARRAILMAELRRVRSVESRLIAAGDHLLFASRRDRDLLMASPDEAPSTVVPNGVDIDYWRRRSPHLGTDEVIFSGAMHYHPNADAALVLLRDIMPRVWARDPGVRVRIVGRDPTPPLVRAGADPRVTITGFVDDVRPHLEAGAVYAAPLRFAAGIQNKLLEAMSMEMPVITSPVASAGLQTDAAGEPPVTTIADPDSFSAAILTAVNRARANPIPDTAARRFVTEHFSWAQALDLMEHVLQRTTRETA